MMRKPESIVIIESTRLLADCIARSLVDLYGKETKVRIVPRIDGMIGELERNFPELILLDCAQRSKEDYQLLNKILESLENAKLIVLCERINRTRYQNLMKLGVNAVVDYQMSVLDLINLIENVWNNKPNDVIEFEDEVKHASVDLVKFTQKELKILQLIRLQMTTTQIATSLGVHSKTVEYHKSRMMEKTNSSKIVGVIEYAIFNSII